MKNILCIVGSASKNSSNLALVNYIVELAKNTFCFDVIDDLSQFPHFNADLASSNTPQKIVDFRTKISISDAVLICTPEYIFSIPSGLKNIFEWCVATTVFAGKPVGLITASANGEKGHQELQLIMRTLEAVFVEETTLLVKGVKGKFDSNTQLNDAKLIDAIHHFVDHFKKAIT
jgi:chromate reductase